MWRWADSKKPILDLILSYKNGGHHFIGRTGKLVSKYIHQGEPKFKMAVFLQKNGHLFLEQEAFLAACKTFGFADQSSLIRAALDDFIKETRRRQRRAQITQKAGELAALYGQNTDLTAFTAIDGDDFL